PHHPGKRVGKSKRMLARVGVIHRPPQVRNGTNPLGPVQLRVGARYAHPITRPSPASTSAMRVSGALPPLRLLLFVETDASFGICSAGWRRPDHSEQITMQTITRDSDSGVVDQECAPLNSTKV